MKFNQYFGIDNDAMNSYGCLNIDLASDTPAFVDPFFFYSSEKGEFNVAYKGLMDYITYLFELSQHTDISDKNIRKLFYFEEPKQNYLGYALYSNMGHGTKEAFASKLLETFRNYGKDSSSHSIPRHLHTFVLFEDGFSDDSISDLTVCLTKDFFASYTEKFAKKHLPEDDRCKNVKIKNAYFDFDKGIWLAKEYYLPIYNGNHILLTPKELISYRGLQFHANQFDTWVKHGLSSDIRERFEQLIEQWLNKAILNNEFHDKIKRDPQFMREYEKHMECEESKAEARVYNHNSTALLENLYGNAANYVISELADTKFYSIVPDNYESVSERIQLFCDRFANDRCLSFINDRSRNVDVGFIKSFMKRVWFANGTVESSDAKRVFPDFRLVKGAHTPKLSVGKRCCYLAFGENQVNYFIEKCKGVNFNVEFIQLPE